MSDAGLYPLYKLHLIDSALYDLKMHAANLDLGQAEAKEIKDREAAAGPAVAEAKALHAELRDRELEQKTLEDKKKKYEKQLFDGSLQFSRDIENVQKEIAMLNELIGKVDERIMELWELQPPAKVVSDQFEVEIADLRKRAAEKRHAAEEEHAALQARYKKKAAERAEAAAAVDPAMLKQYEAVRKVTGSTAMALVKNGNACSHCGMHVPERVQALMRLGRLMPCESCKRILFILVPEA